MTEFVQPFLISSILGVERKTERAHKAFNNVWLPELDFSAISKNILKFEKQFKNILVLLFKN